MPAVGDLRQVGRASDPVSAELRGAGRSRSAGCSRLCVARRSSTSACSARLTDRRASRIAAPDGIRPARDGFILAGATLDLRHARPVGRSLADRRRGGLRRPPPRSRQPPSRSSSRAATSSPPPRPAPARPPPSRCPSSTGCAPHANTSFSPARHPVRTLILVPTRELAMQVDESVRTYGRTVPLRSTVVYGGIPMDPQIKALRGGVEILVATPGRLLDLVGQKVANLGQVEILVLDEADRMLDMGFLPDIQRILELLPEAAPEPDVLGDVLRRHPAPVRDDPARPGHGRGRAAQHRGRDGRAARLPGRPRPQGGAARPPDPVTRPAPGARLHPDQARRDAAGVPPRSRGPRRRGHPQRPLAAGADPGARGLQERRRSGSSSRPTSPPAASTSRTCRSSSTSSCRGTRRTTSTGSAGPAGPGRRARRSAWSASTRSTCCAASSGCSSRPSRGPSRTASSRIGTSSRDRSGCAPGTPGRVAEHHAHRKPVRRRSAGAGASRCPGGWPRGRWPRG